MIPSPDPPAALQTGLRIARTVSGVEVLAGPEWVADTRRWAMHIALDTGAPSELLQQRTEWYLLVDSSYPFGRVTVFPSKSYGISGTFPHQRCNAEGAEALKWRAGNICLDAAGLRRLTSAPDPVGDTEERLRWYLNRALAWVKAAASGSLVQKGDPFELPCPPPGSGQTQVVHDESAGDLTSWASVRAGDWGTVVLDTVPEVASTICAVAFLDRHGKSVRRSRRYDKGRHGRQCKERRRGVWWMWPKPIVLPPWQVPLTWEELRRAGQLLGVRVDRHLCDIAHFCRGKKEVMLLLGYPIPRQVGEPNSEVHWQAIQLPKLVKGTRPPAGFRPNKVGWWRRDRCNQFADPRPIVYVKTENWHPDRLQARGRLDEPLRGRRVALIGCGSLGSIVAELLARGGVEKLLLVDHDRLEAGNLVRHTLDGSHLGQNKAKALAKRLQSTTPFNSVAAQETSLPTDRAELERLLEEFDVVIDCTAEDGVVAALGGPWWSIAKLFVSASVGYRAERALVFAHRGHRFPVAEFHRFVGPVIREERAWWYEEGETLEGAGCWNPVFPARFDDVMQAGLACVNLVEELVREGELGTRFITFEPPGDEHHCGLRRVEHRTDITEGRVHHRDKAMGGKSRWLRTRGPGRSVEPDGERVS